MKKVYRERKVVAIIPAAGSGRRMGGPVNKVYLELMGKPVLWRSVSAFQQAEEVDEIIVAVREDELDFCRREILKEGEFSKLKKLISGGAQRHDTVMKCLGLTEDGSIVLVHDGARPLIDRETISAAVRTVYEKGSCCVAVPVKDTTKLVKNGAVDYTPDRSLLWSAQTPQGFFAGEIRECMEKSMKEGFSGTDEAGFAEKQGKKVFIVEGKYDNIKITTSEDIIFAEAILMERQK